MFYLHPVSNSRYLTHDLTELAAAVSQQIKVHTMPSTPTKTKASPTESNPVEPSPSHSSHSLTPEEQATVSFVFEDDICELTTPRKKRVVSLMGKDEVLGEIMFLNEKVKRVLDRVWYLVQSQQPVGPTNLPRAMSCPSKWKNKRKEKCLLRPITRRRLVDRHGQARRQSSSQKQLPTWTRCRQIRR